MSSAAASNTGEGSASDRRSEGESAAPRRPEPVAVLSDQLIDRMFAIGLRLHNDLVRSRRSAGPAFEPTALALVEEAVGELERLAHDTRTRSETLSAR
ncbi:hypothetical protein [Nocardia wallacei]|uniref:hypothetical protein n=1 Tax=Nocardia TaxID=1817 RepID=UPI002458AA11|nr:hypothetical protein [Nocardia wallacei]